MEAAASFLCSLSTLPTSLTPDDRSTSKPLQVPRIPLADSTQISAKIFQLSSKLVTVPAPNHLCRMQNVQGCVALQFGRARMTLSYLLLLVFVQIPPEDN